MTRRKKSVFETINKAPDIGHPDYEWQKSEDGFPTESGVYLCMTGEKIRGVFDTENTITVKMMALKFDKRRGWGTTALVIFWRPISAIEKKLVEEAALPGYYLND